jgi:hypothetical protein
MLELEPSAGPRLLFTWGLPPQLLLKAEFVSDRFFPFIM